MAYSTFGLVSLFMGFFINFATPVMGLTGFPKTTPTGGTIIATEGSEPSFWDDDPVEYYANSVGFGMVLVPMMVAAMFLFFRLSRPVIRAGESTAKEPTQTETEKHPRSYFSRRSQDH